MKMDGFPAKLVVIAALVLLLMGDFQATCETLLPRGLGKSSLWHIDCRDGLAEIHIGRKQGGKQRTSAFAPDSKDGSRYTFSRREGCFGCQSMNLNKGRQVLLRLRRLQQTRRFTRPPPPPIRNSFRIWSAPPAPPPSLTA
ncbi:unnamed protein product [Prunus armeniaca]